MSLDRSRRAELATHIRHVAASGNIHFNRPAPGPIDPKKRLTDFVLPADIQAVNKWIKLCPWAKQYVNVAATLGSMCPWHVYENGVRSDSPLLQGLADQIKPVRGSQQAMRRRSIALQRQTGQHGIVVAQTDQGVRFRVVASQQISKAKTSPDGFAVLDKPDAKHGTSSWNEYPIDRLKRNLVPSMEWPGVPWSALCDALPMMEMYATMVQAALATVDQRRAVSTLIHLKLDELRADDYGVLKSADVGTPDPLPKPGDGTVDPEMEAITSVAETWRKAYENGGITRAIPDFFLWQGDVDIKEFGQLLPPSTLTDLEQVARRGVDGLPIASMWLLDGPGTANHWGDFELRRDLHTQSVNPEAATNDAFWTEVAFRPIVEYVLGDSVDVSTLELRSDATAIEVKPDNSAQMLELYKAGVVPRACVAEAAGKNPDHLLDIGSMSELEFYMQTLQSSGAGQAATDPGAVSEPERAVAAAGVLELL